MHLFFLYVPHAETYTALLLPSGSSRTRWVLVVDMETRVREALQPAGAQWKLAGVETLSPMLPWHQTQVLAHSWAYIMLMNSQTSDTREGFPGKVFSGLGLRGKICISLEAD